MCTVDVDALRSFNVHNTQEAKNFTLDTPFLTSCQQQGALPFCLLPPTNRLASMCSSTLSSYFDTLLTTNKPLTLDDMPIIWDSIAETSDRPWIDLLASTTDVPPFTPIPPLVSMCASQDAGMLLGVHGGVCYKTNASTGFMELFPHINGLDNMFQNVGLNTTGSFGFVMYYNTFYVWNHQKFHTITHPDSHYVFAKIINDNLLVIVRHQHMTNECIVSLIYNTNQKKEDENVVKYALQDGDQCMWCVFDTKALCVYIAFDRGSTCDIVRFSLQNNQFLKLCDQIPNIYGRCKDIVHAHWESVCRYDETTNNRLHITTVNQHEKRMYFIQLDSNKASVARAPWYAMHIFENSGPKHEFFFLMEKADVNDVVMCVVDNSHIETMTDVANESKETHVTPHYLISLYEGTLNVNLPLCTAFCQTPDGTCTWCFVCDRLSSNGPAELFFCDDGSLKTYQKTPYQLYVNANVLVSDAGPPIGVPAQPTVTWFFGSQLYEVVAIGDVLYSPHQYYRLLVSANVSKTQKHAFPNLVYTYQRANIRVLAQSGVLQLFDNSQTRIVASSGSNVVLWTRNTNDTWGSSDNFSPHTDSTPRFTNETKLISPNGNYIFYTPTNIPGAGPRVVLNIFNSAAFAEYAKQSPERFAQALQMQSDFCWAQLRMPTGATVTTDLEFLDKRCYCVGGPRLLHAIYPTELDPDNNTQTNRPQNSNFALINQNFPCLSKYCQEVLTQPEPSNVYANVQNQCQNAPLTVCSSVITKKTPGTLFDIQQGFIIQECASSLPLMCGEDVLCPLGSNCVDGKCLLDCSSNADCALGSACMNGVCVGTSQQPTSAPIYDWVVAIVLAVAFLIVLILFIVIMTKPTKS